MQNIREYVATKKEELKNRILKSEKKPKLAIVQVNDDVASNAYIRGKIKDLSEIGAEYEHIILPTNTSEEELVNLVHKLNEKEDVTGIIVQMPLPVQINEERIKIEVNPKKDVDGFNPLSKFNPATPFGIVTFLSDNNFDFKGKNALVIGRSNIVGRPMAKLLLDKDMNVTVIHSKTSEEDKKRFIENADLIIVAVGKRYYLKNEFNFKKGAIVIDVGINRDVNNKLAGDCEPELSVKYQTPVPGGVGLLTRLALLINLMETI